MLNLKKKIFPTIKKYSKPESPLTFYQIQEIDCSHIENLINDPSISIALIFLIDENDQPNQELLTLLANNHITSLAIFSQPIQNESQIPLVAKSIVLTKPIDLLKEIYDQIEINPRIIPESDPQVLFKNDIDQRKNNCLAIIQRQAEAASLSFKDFLPFYRTIRIKNIQIQMFQEICDQFMTQRFNDKILDILIDRIYDSLEKRWYQNKFVQYSSQIFTVAIGGLLVVSGVGAGALAAGSAIAGGTLATTSSVILAGDITEKVQANKLDKLTYNIGVVFLECLAGFYLSKCSLEIEPSELLQYIEDQLKDVSKNSEQIIKT